MKTNKITRAVFLLLTGALLISGCMNPTMGDPEPEQIPAAPPGYGVLLASLSGANVDPSLSARTMLPLNPEFTRYELAFFMNDDPSDDTLSSTREPYSFTSSAIRLELPIGTYYIAANGYNGDILAAKSEGKETVTVDSSFDSVSFELKPYIKPDVNGVLSYSLSWDSLSRIPNHADLMIEQNVNVSGSPPVWGSPVWEAIPLYLIPQEITATETGRILLLSGSDALVKLTGSLPLPPGEYKLTVSLTLDEGDEPVSRTDVAHIYSNLTTAGAFYYGSGDLLLSNTSPDSGSSFITSFTFTEKPNATTVIGSQPGADGRRLIMIMVPPETDLKQLTPRVECAPGSWIASPRPTGKGPSGEYEYQKGEIDFSNPTVWTATAKSGATQQYTVVVSETPQTNLDKSITYFFFQGYTGYPGIIDQAGNTITVTLPHGTLLTSLTPVISIIGQKVTKTDGTSPPSADNFGSSKTFKVFAFDTDPLPREYTVTVTVALDTDAEITRFALDGYPGVTASFGSPDVDDYYPISLELPYGVPLTSLTPLIQYKGKSISPSSTAPQNFKVPVYYTVTAEDNVTIKKYKVTINNKPAETNTGIFDFVITNVPAAKVVIGQKPRADGKIPIVVQIPYYADEFNLIPAITLSSPKSTISPATGGNEPIPFGNISNKQEAVYTVTAEDTSVKQQYVVVVSKGGQYYYVDGKNGRDDYPDYYNGESLSYPFKTLAYAVYKASQHATIDHIFVSGELNDTTEGGAWEEGDVIDGDLDPYTNPGFHDTGSASHSVFNLIGTNNKQITITGISGAALMGGVSNKRVLSITGGAQLVFENIDIKGGSAAANEDGGGIYIGENSKVKFNGGSISGNTARSGGGVFVESPKDDTLAEYSSFTLVAGSINGNNAIGASTGTTTSLATLDGGGGVCVSGDALFWLAGGAVSNNTTKGSGGGVLVRGRLVDTGYTNSPSLPNYGVIMNGGAISGNNSTGGSSPHGGGGVYVATGEFEMPEGQITTNKSSRQGGGVFVHSGAIFGAWGNSTITGNTGTGSSKGICSRGITTLAGNAQVDTVYVWNPLAEDGGIVQNMFSLSGNARVAGIVLAYSQEHRNFINVEGIGVSPSSINPTDGTSANPKEQDQIGILDLEGHLTNYSFVDTDINDWLNQIVFKGEEKSVKNIIHYNRLRAGTFVGGSSISLSSKYKIAIDGSTGKLVKQ